MRNIVISGADGSIGYVKVSYEKGVLHTYINANVRSDGGRNKYLFLLDSKAHSTHFELRGSNDLSGELKQWCDFDLSGIVVAAVCEVGKSYYAQKMIGGNEGKSGYFVVIERYFKSQKFYEDPATIPNVQESKVNANHQATGTSPKEAETINRDIFLQDTQKAQLMQQPQVDSPSDDYGYDEAKLAAIKKQLKAAAATFAESDVEKTENLLFSHSQLASEGGKFSRAEERIIKSETQERVSQIENLIDNSRKKQLFYDRIRAQLYKIFLNYESELPLEAAIENSRWAKVVYGSSGEYYTVGVIYEGNKPSYICYGVPASSNDIPPKELIGYCEWLPIRENGGYWVMYQDAATGDGIKFSS